MIVVGNDWTIWNTRHGLFVGVYSIYIMVDDMAKMKLDFTAYLWRRHADLDPVYLKQCRAFLDQLPRSNPFQATSNKPQAASNKRQALDKSK